MSATLDVPEKMADTLRAFVEKEGISLNIVAGGEGAVRVVESEQGQQSKASTICAGGGIGCGLARDMAGRLGIKTRDFGKLLNQLDVKVRNCELGCFE